MAWRGCRGDRRPAGGGISNGVWSFLVTTSGVFGVFGGSPVPASMQL